MNPCFKIGKFFWKAAGEKSFHSCSSLCFEGSYGKVEADQGEDVLVLQCKETQCANEQASAGHFRVGAPEILLKKPWCSHTVYPDSAWLCLKKQGRSWHRHIPVAAETRALISSCMSLTFTVWAENQVGISQGERWASMCLIPVKIQSLLQEFALCKTPRKADSRVWS